MKPATSSKRNLLLPSRRTCKLIAAAVKVWHLKNGMKTSPKFNQFNDNGR